MTLMLPGPRICRGVGDSPCPTQANVGHGNRKRCLECSRANTKLQVKERNKAQYISRKRMAQEEPEASSTARVSYAAMSAQVDAVLKFTL